MLWRPSCPPFCVHVTNISEINFHMLNRFLDLKNVCVATKIMCLAHVLKKILRILSFGGHLGRHHEYLNLPNDAKVASFSFNVRTYWITHLCKNILCGLFLGLHPKSSFGNRTRRSTFVQVRTENTLNAYVNYNHSPKIFKFSPMELNVIHV